MGKRLLLTRMLIYLYAVINRFVTFETILYYITYSLNLGGVICAVCILQKSMKSCIILFKEMREDIKCFSEG